MTYNVTVINFYEIWRKNGWLIVPKPSAPPK